MAENKNMDPIEQNQPQQTQQKSNGALVGSVIIIVILIIGGIYFWQTKLKDKAMPVENVGGDSVSSDDSLNLEADLNSIDLESLDSGI
jgi:hypothetical protein